MNKDFKVGIVGAGWIAEKAAITLNGLEGFRPYAIGSRSLEKAKAFAAKWGLERAYGAYSEVLDDPEVDLIYVATPHSHHFGITKEALEKGKPCLVEKAFMANRQQAHGLNEQGRQRRAGKQAQKPGFAFGQGRKMKGFHGEQFLLSQ